MNKSETLVCLALCLCDKDKRNIPKFTSSLFSVSEVCDFKVSLKAELGLPLLAFAACGCA